MLFIFPSLVLGAEFLDPSKGAHSPVLGEAKPKSRSEMKLETLKRALLLGDHACPADYTPMEGFIHRDGFYIEGIKDAASCSKECNDKDWNDCKSFAYNSKADDTMKCVLYEKLLPTSREKHEDYQFCTKAKAAVSTVAPVVDFEENRCPASFPYIYYGGAKCCKENEECTTGDVLKKKSKCCQGPPNTQGSAYYCFFKHSDETKRCDYLDERMSGNLSYMKA